MPILLDCPNEDEIQKITQLESNVTVPVLDQPITTYEMTDSYKDMKNGGFDFNQPILGH